MPLDLTTPPESPVTWRAFVVRMCECGQRRELVDTGRTVEDRYWYTAQQRLVAETGLDPSSIVVQRDKAA